MSKKLSGRLNLSKIDKSLIQTDKNGDKYIWIDVVERKEVGKYGDTHSVTLYNKEAKQTIYLADLKPKDFGGGSNDMPDFGGGKDEGLGF